MNIYFKREGTTVYAQVQTDLNVEKSVFPFSFQCSNEYSAELLVKHLDASFDELIKAIRQDEYSAGWTDAKKRQERHTRFSSTLPYRNGENHP